MVNFSKTSFIELAEKNGVLRFGEFILKSGRKSPYFFNAGLFYQADSLKKLGQYYAKVLIDNEIEFQHLFGPAYKGLPLATATAIALAEQNKNCTVTFNRKEVKDHGEGGVLIGAPLTGKTVLIDDVISAGTAFREGQQLIVSQGGILTTVIIALNRCEKGLGDTSAIQDIEAQGINVLSIISVYDLIDYLQDKNKMEEARRIMDYLQQYGY